MNYELYHTFLQYIRPEKMPCTYIQFEKHCTCMYTCMHAYISSTCPPFHHSASVSFVQAESSLPPHILLASCLSGWMWCTAERRSGNDVCMRTSKHTQGAARCLESDAYHHTCHQITVISPSVHVT